jgi:hypothetical protein
MNSVRENTLRLVIKPESFNEIISGKKRLKQGKLRILPSGNIFKHGLRAII